MSRARRAIDLFDLEMYLTRHGAHSVKRHEWLMDCPVCGKEDKLSVNTDRKAWHCWVCEEYVVQADGKKVASRGAGGLLSLMQLLDGCSREGAVQVLLEGSGMDAGLDIASVLEEDPDLDYLENSPTTLRPAPAIPPPEGWRPIQSTHYGILTYLQRRGIMWGDVAAFGLFWCESGRYATRLVFPVWERAQMVYYQARATWDDPGNGRKYLKSLNPPKHGDMASPSEVLMNLDQARHYPRVAIVEGPVDCIHAGPSAVATFGKKISPVQALKLRYAGVKAVDLMWDGPSPTEPVGAWPEMVQAASQLSGLFEDVRLVFLPKGDPGEYTREDLDGFRAQARPASTISRLAML